jgi:hypothetical protein
MRVCEQFCISSNARSQVATPEHHPGMPQAGWLSCQSSRFYPGLLVAFPTNFSPLSILAAASSKASSK